MTGNDPYALVKKDTGFQLQRMQRLGNNCTVMDVIGYPNANSDPYAVKRRFLHYKTSHFIFESDKQGNTTWSNSRGTSASDCDWVVTTSNDRSDRYRQHTQGTIDSTATCYNSYRFKACGGCLGWYIF